MKTKTHLLDRQLIDLERKRRLAQERINDLNAALNMELDTMQQLNEDIATIEQLISDLFPDPRD